MKVNELIEALKRFPQNSEVAITYESVVEFLDDDDVYMSRDGVVLIGCDYKDEFISGKMSAKEFGGYNE